jgi:hypothetical protein
LIWTTTKLETRRDSFSNGGGKMMKTELMMLLALIAVCANSISAQATIPVAEVDQISHTAHKEGKSSYGSTHHSDAPVTVQR